jgi:hypothetical protein
MVETLLSPTRIKLYGRVVTELLLLNVDDIYKGAIGAANTARANITALPSVIKTAVSDYANTLKDKALNTGAVGVAGAVATIVDSLRENRVENSPRVVAEAVRYAAQYNYSNGLGRNNFLQNQLTSPEPKLARIYGFSFEGQYYDLPRPALFLVHTSGDVLREGFRFQRTTLDMAGVLAKEWEFSDSDAADVRVWEYDKGDFSMRMDIETGQFEQILLAAVMRSGSSLGAAHNLGSAHNLGMHNLGIGGVDPRNRK